MKSISDITEENPIVRSYGAQQEIVTRQNITQRVSNDDAINHINFIFAELCAAFPAWRNTFRNQIELDDAKRSWVKGLIEADVTDLELIKTGLKKARASDSDFFPSVGKFISWCNSNDDFLLPDAEFAFQSLPIYMAGFRNQIPAPTLAAFDQIGKPAIRKKNERDVFKLFKYSYELVCKRVKTNKPIDDLLIKPLPKPKPKKLSPKFVEAKRDRVLSKIQIFKQENFGR